MRNTKKTEWALLKQHGDIEAIHSAKNISKDKIRKAFDYGDFDSDTKKAIDSFFSKRKKQLA